MRVYYLFYLLFISFCSFAEPLKLEGELVISDHHGKVLNFWLSGTTAKTIYEQMEAEPVYDECLGGSYKEEGDFHCFVLDTKQYNCNFGIDLKRNGLRKTKICD